MKITTLVEAIPFSIMSLVGLVLFGVFYPSVEEKERGVLSELDVAGRAQA